LLEPNPADAANDRMPEGECARLGSREADHSQEGADGTKSKSYEGAVADSFENFALTGCLC
jgi:hypothetical protein